MSRRMFGVLVIVLGVLMLAVMTRAGVARPKAEPDRSQWGFIDWMKQAGRSMEAIDKMLNDPHAGPERLHEVEQLQWALLNMKTDIPQMTVNRKAMQKFHNEDAARTDMRRGLNEALQSALRLESALLADNIQAAHGELAALVQTEHAMHHTHKGSREDDAAANGHPN